MTSFFEQLAAPEMRAVANPNSDGPVFLLLDEHFNTDAAQLHDQLRAEWRPGITYGQWLVAMVKKLDLRLDPGERALLEGRPTYVIVARPENKVLINHLFTTPEEAEKLIDDLARARHFPRHVQAVRKTEPGDLAGLDDTAALIVIPHAPN